MLLHCHSFTWIINDTKSPKWSLTAVLHRTFEHEPSWSKQYYSPNCTLCPWAGPHLHLSSSGIIIYFLWLSHFPPYPKFRTFFSFTMKFQLSQFEAQTKHWKGHSTKLINYWLLHWYIADKKEMGKEKVTFWWNSCLNLQKLDLCTHLP